MKKLPKCNTRKKKAPKKEKGAFSWDSRLGVVKTKATLMFFVFRKVFLFFNAISIFEKKQMVDPKMRFEDLKKLYLKKKERLGDEAYKHVSELLREAKELHREDWLKHPTPNRDHEQSWRAFKGKNLEKLVQYIITNEVEEFGLKVVNGNKLERTTNLSKELSHVKRNLAIDYGEFGLHLPDVDIIIYHPQNYKVLVAISSKVTLRERIAQTGYWKLKLLQDDATKHIRVYFITPDEDGTLTYKKPIKKGRAIVESDLDGSYVLTEEEIEESNRVKLFENFVEDLKRLLKND